MKKSIILAALVAPTIGFAQDPRPVSLPEALDLARRNSPTMIQARGQIRTSSMQLRQAKWAYFPLNNISLSYGSSTGGGGSYDEFGDLRTRQSDWSFSQGIGSGATFTIWDGGSKWNTIKQRSAQRDAAEINEITQRYSLAAQVKQQYYSIIQATEAEAAARSQIAQAQQQLRAAVARVSAGTAIGSDSLQAVVALGNAQLQLFQARNNAANASAQLTRLTGSDYPVTAIVSDTSDPPPLRMSDADLLALAEVGPSIRSQTASVATSRAGERVASAIRWPTIDARAGYSRSNSDKQYDFGAGPMNYSWNFSISASYTIWNNWARESSLLSSRIALDNAEAALRNERLLVRQNVTQQLGALRTAEQQILISRTNLVAAEAALRVQTVRYEAGAGNLLDVLTAQNTLNSVRSTLIQQRFTLRNARAQLESLIGRELQ